MNGMRPSNTTITASTAFMMRERSSSRWDMSVPSASCSSGSCLSGGGLINSAGSARRAAPAHSGAADGVGSGIRLVGVRAGTRRYLTGLRCGSRRRRWSRLAESAAARRRFELAQLDLALELAAQLRRRAPRPTDPLADLGGYLR